MKDFTEKNAIQLRNVKVHNLKSVDLDLPYYKLIAFCGLSGSGKSSLAIDTLYAEGQRRYIESFSAFTRQFLEKLEKPDVERIEGIPPAIAVTSRQLPQLCRSTVGTVTETSDYMRLLFSKIGQLYCQECGRAVKKDSADSFLDAFKRLKDDTRVIIAFSPPPESFQGKNLQEFQAFWQEAGFQRGIVLGESFRLDETGSFQKNFGFASLLYLASVPETEEEIRKEESRRYFSGGADKENTGQEIGDLFSEFDENGSSKDKNSADSQSFQTGNNDSDSSISEVIDAEINNSNLNGADRDSDQLDADFSLNGSSQQGSGDSEEDNPYSGMTEEELKESSRILTLEPDSEIWIREYLEKRNSRRHSGGSLPPLFFIVDRVTSGKTALSRVREAFETAFQYGNSRCWVFCEGTEFLSSEVFDEAIYTDTEGCRIGKKYQIDGQDWTLFGFSRRLRCEDCDRDYPELEPKLFSFNSPLGACPLCEGFGNLMMLDENLIIPNKKKSIQDGAIAPWNSSSYKHKLRELLEKAEKFGVRTNVPYEDLTKEEIRFVLKGNEEYEGLSGFFVRLQKQKYKMHIRVFLSRWRSYRVCPLCNGARLRPEALAVRLGKYRSKTDGSIVRNNIQDFSSMQISEFLDALNLLELAPWQKEIGRDALLQVRSRLSYLMEVGLGYLTLDRLIRTLSEGEQRRVSLTSVLGSTLVDVLYVLDEPSIGLHPDDTKRLLDSILKLRDRGNTVVVVEHEESILEASDHIVEVGPEAGMNGGKIVFQGTFEEIKKDEKSRTGNYLAGRRFDFHPAKRRFLDKGFLELKGASGHNLKNVNAIFPLGVLCVVTGVSGSGKSSLVQETLYPALCRKLGKECLPGLPFDEILGSGNIDDVIMVDQSPIGRSPRSNPVTYLKIFDDIRNLFAETPEAKARNYNAGYFSFNVDGGRCNTCKGEGYIYVDMQFMADTYMKCPQCGGRRYQHEILDILYRGKNIAEVLELTVREAFSFFRGQAKIQQKLKRLMDVGLDYIQLGQPANTLSGGESQRLKLVSCLANVKKGKCLFILDEPTTGLHFADVIQLIDSFDALIETGHSLVVVEHNLQMMKVADYIVDLGPAAANDGGRIVAEGTPEEVAQCPESKTGRILADLLDVYRG